MTNPRVCVKGKVDLKATKKLRNRDPLSNEEIDAMLSEADSIENKYFELRAKALIALAKKFGKRRSEIAALSHSDLKVENNQLYVTFTLAKNTKKGYSNTLNG